MMMSPKTYKHINSSWYLEVLNLPEENHGRLNEAYAEPHENGLPEEIQVDAEELHDDHVDNI